MATSILNLIIKPELCILLIITDFITDNIPLKPSTFIVLHLQGEN